MLGFQNGPEKHGPSEIFFSVWIKFEMVLVELVLNILFQNEFFVNTLEKEMNPQAYTTSS